MKKFLVVFGTRPEAIKLAPVISKLRENKSFFDIRVCSTSQHKKMLDQVINLFKINIDYNLKIMRKNQKLSNSFSLILKKLQYIIDNYQPNFLIVQGDTTTALAGSIVSFYNKISLIHIEAGLRTKNLYSPYPEEFNRRVISLISEYNFCPTQESKKNLIKEGFDKKKIFVTGNTVIDSLIAIDSLINTKKNIKKKIKKYFSFIDFSKKIILVTLHRRENIGSNITNICKALRILSKNQIVQILFPVHLNPNIKKIINLKLKNIPNIYLCEPLKYLNFIYILKKSDLIISDSGGIQEEAPFFNIPLLVTRDDSERPEGLNKGSAILVGSSVDKILFYANKILKNKMYTNFNKNLYGNGNASNKIISVLKKIK